VKYINFIHPKKSGTSPVRPSEHYAKAKIRLEKLSTSEVFNYGEQYLGRSWAAFDALRRDQSHARWEDFEDQVEVLKAVVAELGERTA
jgi:hypothetical protein